MATQNKNFKVKNGLDVTSGTATVPVLVGTDTTDSSSSTTGAFKTSGGMGIAKKLYVGTDLNVGGTVNAATLDLTTAATATAATSYFVETGSDGVVRPKTLANVKSEVVTPAAVNIAMPSWDTYVTTWGTNAGGAPTLGNGTMTMRYCQIGKTVHFTLQMTMGSTTNFSNGSQWTWTLPMTAAAAGVAVGAATLVDAGSLSFRTGTALLLTTSTIWIYPASNGVVGYQVPFTWASTDSITIAGFYEAA